MSNPLSTHRCPGEGCVVPVPHNQLACRHHWFRVSRETRTRVWEAYRTNPDDHTSAIVAAIKEMNA
jgi:hypothetical protein